MIENEEISKDTVIMACVKYMSEADVADMMEANEIELVLDFEPKIWDYKHVMREQIEMEEVFTENWEELIDEIMEEGLDLVWNEKTEKYEKKLWQKNTSNLLRGQFPALIVKANGAW